MERPTAIRVRGLHRIHRRRGGEDLVALNALDLDIAEGSWTALLGPNGSGKSTMLRSFAGMEHPDAGTLELFGSRVRLGAFDRPTRARLGVVFQTPSLDPLLSVRENLSLQARACAIADAPARIAALSEAFDLAGRLDDRVSTLSGGLARRADLARALLHRPSLLILDEPTSGLDPRARHEFWMLLRKLSAAEPRTILLATHLLDEAELAERVLFMDRGRIVGDGEPRELRLAHAERIVRLERDEPELRDALAAGGFTILPGREGTIHATGGAMTPVLLDRLGATGCAVEVGPATLADVYLAKTGRPLDGEGA